MATPGNKMTGDAAKDAGDESRVNRSARTASEGEPHKEEGRAEGASYRVQIPLYEGPLDLLLDLIKKQEMNIHDIQISLITAQYLEYLHKLERERGRSVKAGVIPVISIDEDRDKARANINVHALATSSEGSKDWIKPPSGEFQTVDDLEGLLLAGDPDDIVRDIRCGFPVPLSRACP